MRSILGEIWNYWVGGGGLLVPIAGVAIAILYHLRRLSRHFRSALAEAEMIEDRLGLGTGEPFKQRRPVLERSTGPTAGYLDRAVRDALKQSSSGSAAREQVESVLRARRAGLDGRMRMLAALTAAAPLLGLLGTVSGMTTTFAGAAGAWADPARQVAGGIGVALMTTQYGLMAALPGVFGLVHVERLRARLIRRDGTIGMLVCVAHPKEAAHV